MKQENNSTPSILSAVQKLRELLTREEKIKWLGIAGLALAVSILEVVTASAIVVFAQVLNDPSVGQKYFQKIGITENLSPGKTVFYVAIAVGVIYLVKNLIAATEVFFQNFSIQKMCHEFKNKLLHRYAKADYGFYLTRNSYFGIQLIGGDVEQTFSNGLTPLVGIISESIIFIFLISFITYLNPSLALVVFSAVLMTSIVFSKKLLPKFYNWGIELQSSGLEAGQSLMHFFHAFKEISLHGKIDFFIRKHQESSIKKARIQAIQFTGNALPKIILEFLFVSIFVVSICYLCLTKESPMSMIGILAGYLYIGFRLMPGLNRIIGYSNMLKSSIPFISRVYEEYKNISSPNGTQDVNEFRFEHSINFENVSFSYIKSNKEVLSNIKLNIKKGECLGIVGETGSGKSTLIDLLLGLLRPVKGSVLIDNKYPANSLQWHQKIGYVPQSIYLLDSNIEQNIAFGEENIDKDKLNQAIDAAQLRKFVNSLPDGTKTLVGERGVCLSGGERQRITIARALYRNPEVLIFDEATSGLDSETESRLMETINSVKKERTVIMIAHRITTLKGCDRIIQIKEGDFKSIDSYEDLHILNNEMEQYAKA